MTQLILADSHHPGARLMKLTNNSVKAIGVWDVPSAGIVSRTDSFVAFLSGNSVVSAIGEKDTGAYTADHAISWTERIMAAYPDLILLVDVDGFFNLPPEEAVKVANRLEALGAAGVVYDDQEPQNRKPGMTTGKTQISLETNKKVLTSVINGRNNQDFVIVARTSDENQQSAIERVKMYDQVRADIIIAESLNTDGPKLQALASNLKNSRTSVIHISKGSFENIWPGKKYMEENIGLVIIPDLLSASAMQGMQRALNIAEEMVSALDIYACSSAGNISISSSY